MAEENKEKENLQDEVKDISLDYSNKKIPGEITEEQRKEMEKTKKELENLKRKILSRYKFSMAIGILPPQAAEKIEEEENVPLEEAKKKPIHMVMIIPEEKFKNLSEIGFSKKEHQTPYSDRKKHPIMLIGIRAEKEIKKVGRIIWSNN